MDCSRRSGSSVNSITDEVCVKFSYKSVNTVAELMEAGDWMYMVDIKDAYRAVCIHPEDRDSQGLL